MFFLILEIQDDCKTTFRQPSNLKCIQYIHSTQFDIGFGNILGAEVKNVLLPI